MVKVSVIIPVYNQEELVIKALNSIPNRYDVDIIVIDDGSTDNTYQNILRYMFHNENKNILLLQNEKNKGVGYTVNKGYDNAIGEYVVLLGSDDYFYTDKFEEIMEELDGTDLVYFNVQVNNGDIWELNNDVKRELCGSFKFMRREFVGSSRCAVDKISGEDKPFFEELLAKNPTEKFTNIVVKHYNHPRDGSLTDLVRKGIIND